MSPLRLPLCSALIAASVLLVGCPATTGDLRGNDPLGAIFGVGAGSGGSQASAPLLEGEILAGLREALAQGTTRAVKQLGRTDGFWADTARRIPVPASLEQVESTLRRVGLNSVVDEFHLTLNRAAEQAVPEAADLLGDAIRQMSVADARAILQGEPDAATRYFERVAGPALEARFRPLVSDVTSRVGVTQQYRSLMQSAGPLLQLAGAGTAVDLDGYVTDRTLQGLFTLMAEEERRIRENPAARGTELLKRVFGGRS